MSMFSQPEDDITLENIDYEWVEKTTSIKMLRRALAILKHDGFLNLHYSFFIYSFSRRSLP